MYCVADLDSVWDWKRQIRLNQFSNGNPSRSRITDLKLINEDDQALLMTGSSDGVVKLFRHYELREKAELVTSFRALTDLESSNRNAGLVFDWQQSRGQILVAGDVRQIRVWNAGTEISTAVRASLSLLFCAALLTRIGYQCSIWITYHVFDI